MKKVGFILLGLFLTAGAVRVVPCYAGAAHACCREALQVSVSTSSKNCCDQKKVDPLSVLSSQSDLEKFIAHGLAGVRSFSMDLSVRVWNRQAVSRQPIQKIPIYLAQQSLLI